MTVHVRNGNNYMDLTWKKTLKPAKTNANPIGAATIANPLKLKYTIQLYLISTQIWDRVRDPDPGTRMRESKFTAEPCKDMLKNKYT